MQVKWVWYNPFYVHCKKHFCPKCSTKMITIKVKRVINSRSLEARDFNFSTVDGEMTGDVKFVWDEFICPECHYQISINSLRSLEKGTDREK